MSPIILGILLGIANVVANALLFAGVGDEPRAAGLLVTYGMLPGIVAGSVIGVIASATASSRRGARLFVLGAPAVLVVLVLGAAFGLMSFVPIALVPTVLACVILERYSRAPAPLAGDAAGVALDPGQRPRSAVKLAMLLGAVVMFVAMAGVSAKDPTMNGFLGAYVPWGLGCGLGLSAPFGVLADYTRDCSVWLRRLALLIPAFALTFALGTLMRLEDLILIAFIPVAAGCLMLERYSRRPPIVPTAVASF